MKLRNFFGHLNTVNKHKLKVLQLCIYAGIPVRGLLHDLSKYTPTEFIEGVKYYTDGKKSPISTRKKEVGYSNAWLHHKGRNKHHFEYWYDFNAPIKTPLIPFKYFAEMVCDTLAASITYNGKNWTPKTNYDYFKNRKDLDYINPCIIKMLEHIYKELIKTNDIKKVLKKSNLKKIYNKYK